MMSSVETVEVQRPDTEQPAGDGEWRRRRQRPLLERAAADGLTQQAMEAIRTSEGWQRWLEVRCNLGATGLNLYNLLLVANQRPGARRLATPRGWLTLGHEVRSGENPIRVWAQIPPASAALREWKEAGSPPEERPAGELRLVDAFDQDQVSPLADAPGPSEIGPAARSSDTHKLICMLGQLIKFGSEIGSPVSFEPIAATVRAYHEPGTGEIVIDSSSDFPPAARAQRLAYELANVLIDDDPRRRGLRLGNGEREAVARSVTFCVAQRAGVAPPGPIAVPLHWVGEPALAAVGYAAMVDRIAARLEAALVAGINGEQR
jgi:hypothetical protein